jgi:hypothetical protein
MVAVSHLTARPDYAAIASLTYETTTQADRRRTRASWNWRDVAASALVLSAITFAYLYFRG